METRVGRPLVTIKEASNALGITEDELEELLRRRKLKYVEYDGVRMIHQSHLDQAVRPWHILFRMEERIDAQQKLVETLKNKLLHTSECNTHIFKLESAFKEFDEENTRWYNDTSKFLISMKDDLEEKIRRTSILYRIKKWLMGIWTAGE